MESHPPAACRRQTGQQTTVTGSEPKNEREGFAYWARASQLGQQIIGPSGGFDQFGRECVVDPDVAIGDPLLDLIG